MGDMERQASPAGRPPSSPLLPCLLAFLAVAAPIAGSPSAGAQDGPRAERPTYAVGEEWFRSDGVYELIRIENDRYVFAAGPEREIHLTRDLAVAKMQRGNAVMEFDPPPAFAWPLAVGQYGTSSGTWRTPRAPGGLRATFTWTVEGHEDIQVAAGTFKAFKIRLAVRWPPLARFPRQFQFWLWYAPEARQIVKIAGDQPGLLDFELAHFDRSGAASAALASGSPPGTAPPGGKRYGVEFLETLEAVKRGEGREALAYYEGLAERRERQGVPLEEAKAKSAVTFTASRLGAYQKAIRSGLRALELFKRGPQSEENLGRQLSVYSHLGVSYLGVGDLKEARRYYQEGLDLTKTSTNAQRIVFFSGVLASGLAWAANLEGDNRAALGHGEEAVQSLERFLANLSPGPRFDTSRGNATRLLALSLARLGSAQRLVGRTAEAEASVRRALSLAKAAGQPEAEVAALVSLGRIALAERDYPRGLVQFQEAEALASRANLFGSLMWAQDGIGRSYAGQGQNGEALAAFRRAVDMVEDLRAQLQEAGLRGEFLENKQAIYHGAVRSALALGRGAEAFSYAERARARAFLDLLGNQTTLSKGKTRALADEEARLRAQLTEAEALMQGAGGEEEGAGDLAMARQQVENAQRAYRTFLERVRKENLEQASLMTVDPVTLPEVQGLLPEGTTLLEYLVTETETILWLLDRQRVEVIRTPIARRDLVGQVRAFRQAIGGQAPLAQIQDEARGLYDRLLAAARPHLRGDRLLIIPHDVLHYLPFGALRTPEGHWLIEDYTVATLPSASVLKYLQGKGAEAGTRALAVGNPDLGPALALRYAEREARLVGQRFAGATVLVRQEATEAKAKALSGAAGWLHFATHGELNEKDPLASALLLVPEGREDGRLEVREIFGLDLKARLVVLSACETGLGQLSRGDELVGLQRAFLYAGTPAVVTTLWKVDDRASYRLMEHFYGALATAGPAAALRQAQHATMGQFPHPFAWAAFGLTGVPW